MTQPSYRLSLSTGSLYHWPLDSVFRLARDVGLDGVELVIGPEALAFGPGRLAVLMERHSLPILSLHPPILPLPGWLRFEAMVDRILRWAAALAVPVVTIHTPDVATLDCERGRRYVAGAARLAHGLAQCGSRLALENRALFSGREGPMCLDAPDDLRAFAATLGDAITFDTAHAGTLYADILGAFTVLAPRVVNVHLSDLTAGRGLVAPRWTDTILRHHQLLGAGRLPLDGILRQLHAQEYGGLVTLEFSPVALCGWSPAATRRSLLASRDYVRSRLG